MSHTPPDMATLAEIGICLAGFGTSSDHPIHRELTKSSSGSPHTRLFCSARMPEGMPLYRSALREGIVAYARTSL